METKNHIRQELEESCRLTFRVCRTIFEDEDSYAVIYGIKGQDEAGNLRVHIREISESLLRVQRLVRRLNASVFSQAHLMDLIDGYLEEAEREEKAQEGPVRWESDLLVQEDTSGKRRTDTPAP